MIFEEIYFSERLAVSPLHRGFNLRILTPAERVALVTGNNYRLDWVCYNRQPG